MLYIIKQAAQRSLDGVLSRRQRLVRVDNGEGK